MKRTLFSTVTLMFAVLGLAQDQTAPQNDQTQSTQTQSSQTQSTQTQTVGPEVIFLEGYAGQRAIGDDSAMPYFSLLQPREMAAKTGAPLTATTLDAQREETRQRYRDGVMDFTDTEKDFLRGAVAATQPHVARNLPLLAETPWVFIKLGDHIEGGLPHTRGHFIVLSQQMLQGLQYSTQMMEQQNLPPLPVIMLFIHEQTHVFERANPDFFADYYQEQWNFVRQAVALPDDLKQRQLLNPDAVVCDWVKKHQGEGKSKWFLPLVGWNESETPSMPADMLAFGMWLDKKNGKFLPIQQNGVTATTPLKDIDGYADLFIPNASLYHPEELMADHLAWLALLDSGMLEAMIPPQQLEALNTKLTPLRTWLRSR